MKYIQNNTDKPISIMLLAEQTEKRIVQSVLDPATGKVEKVQQDVTFLKPVGDLYFPEEVNGEYFPVALTDEEYKALEKRPDFQALRKGSRPWLSIVDYPSSVSKRLDQGARAKDIKGLYSNDQSLIDAHRAMLED